MTKSRTAIVFAIIALTLFGISLFIGADQNGDIKIHDTYVVFPIDFVFYFFGGLHLLMALLYFVFSQSKKLVSAFSLLHLLIWAGSTAGLIWLAFNTASYFSFAENYKPPFIEASVFAAACLFGILVGLVFFAVNLYVSPKR